jgi:hypothetical protein
MKALISVASVLACAFLLDAQISTTLKPLPDGSTQFRITNDTAVDLTAFAISVNETNGVIENGRLIVYEDAAIDAASAPVLPHQQGLVEAGLCVMPLNRKGACTAFGQPIVLANLIGLSKPQSANCVSQAESGESAQPESTGRNHGCLRVNSAEKSLLVRSCDAPAAASEVYRNRMKRPFPSTIPAAPFPALLIEPGAPCGRPSRS